MPVTIEHHHERERVDQELEPDLELACLEPRPRRRQLGAVVGIAAQASTNAATAPAKPTNTDAVEMMPAWRRVIRVPGEQDREEAGERREQADPAAVDHRASPGAP